MYNINQLFEAKALEAVNVIHQFLGDGSMTIKHPTLDVLTFPRESKISGMSNIILFSDEALDNHWYYIQVTKLIDGYYVPNDKFFNPKNMPDVLKAKIAIDSTSLQFDLKSTSIKIDGLVFSQTRPYHYFYDQFVNYFKLSAIKNIDKYCFTNETCFYSETESTSFDLITDNGCYFFPCTIPGNYQDDDTIKMHQFLKKNSFKVKNENEFTLWLGITGQKRSWVEQVDGYVEIIKMLGNLYNDITVVIDGWTNFENDNSVNVEDNDVYHLIADKFINTPSVSLINLINKDYKSKITHVNNCDYFIANSGTGCMVPFMIANIKGVIHGNGQLDTFLGSYNENIRTVPKEKINAESSGLIMNDSYSIRWEVIYNLLMDLMGGNERLDEPKLQPDSKIILSQLTFSNKTQPADALREMALAFKKIGDKNTAYTLMCKALEQRPDGSFIKEKVKEWSNEC
jgi:hypothetical protein